MNSVGFNSNNPKGDTTILLLIFLISILFIILFSSCTASKTAPTQPSSQLKMSIEITSDDEKRDGVKYFVIEKSRDGIKWVNVATVTATGQPKYTVQIQEDTALYKMGVFKQTGLPDYKNVIRVR